MKAQTLMAKASNIFTHHPGRTTKKEKTMERSSHSMIVVLTSASLFILPVAQSSAQQCTNKVVRGIYNTNCVGFDEGIQARFNSVATNTFHGDGTWEGVDVEKIEGVPFIIRTSFCGTYEVTDNCELHVKFLDVRSLPDIANCDSIPPDQAPLATFDGGVFGLDRGRPAEGATIINTGFIDANGDPAIGNTSCTARLVGAEPEDNRCSQAVLGLPCQ